MFQKTGECNLINSVKNTYNSFPTAVTDKDKLTVFFRQGRLKQNHPHGFYGRVLSFNVALDEFYSCFQNGNKEFKDRCQVVFQGDNELDAIVSKLSDSVYSLGTREYIKGCSMKTFLSVSDSPDFKERMEIKIKGTQWVIFYGKAFKWEQGYIFPAYGPLKNDNRSRPLVLITDDFSHWDILSYIEGETFLNESSIVFNNNEYSIFIRENQGEFGIWQSSSTDLQNWSKPKKMFPNAHAPMGFCYNNQQYVVFRDILEEEKGGVSIYSLKTKEKVLLDSYYGNIYDGGYSDPVLIDNTLFVFYYLGNKSGEPSIKCAMLKEKAL
jgi:hypothetical protein